jgi:predicted Zn-ribbon and HTH transcriptional regulator
MKITPQDHQLTGFAEACFDTNSVPELIEGLLERSADKTDCKQWNITPTQWREAIKQALEFRLFCMETKETVQVIKCKRCEHGWLPRSTENPTICPKCKSPYWNKPRKEKK